MVIIIITSVDTTVEPLYYRHNQKCPDKEIALIISPKLLLGLEQAMGELVAP
jgi:hypothetical protein